MWYNLNMDLNNLVLDISEVFRKTYSIIRTKPYATVKVRFAQQGEGAGKVIEELIALTIINEGFGVIDVQKVWFLTSYNRPIYSESIDSKMPIKVLENDRATYFIPIEELKMLLNRSAGETITRAVVLDKAEHKYEGRVDKVAQEEFTK